MKNIFIHSFLFFCFAFSMKAQVVCTDVQPDATYSANATLDIDLNNDATPDFRLTSTQINTLSFVIAQAQQIGTGNSVLTTGTGSVLALTAGSPIGPSSTTWTQMNSGNQFMVLCTGTTVTGTWPGANDLYMGLCLTVGTNTYYGWARFSFSNIDNSYIFKDYAYQSTPGGTIAAGYGCGSLSMPVVNLPAQACQGQSISLSANTGSTSSAQYFWATQPTVGATFSSPFTASTSVTFTSSGTYTVFMVATLGNTTGLFQSTIAVDPTPTITTNAPVCQGDQLTLSVNGGTSFAWSGPGGFSSSAQSNTITAVTPTMGGTYHVIVPTSSICIYNITVTVNINLKPTLSLSSNSMNICQYGNTVAVIASGSGTLYNWSPSTVLPSSSSYSIIPQPTASTVYTVTSTLANCTTSMTIPVIITPPGIFSMNSSNNFVICQHGNNKPGSTLTVTFVTSNTYTLLNVTSSVLNATIAPPHQVAFSSSNNLFTGAVTNTAHLSNGICHVNIPFNILVNPDPVINVTLSKNVVCPGDTLTLKATGADTFSITSQSSFSSVITSTAALAPGTNMTYLVAGTASDCVSSTTTVSVSVFTNSTLVAPDLNICTNETRSMTASGVASYTWMGPNGFTSNQATFLLAGYTTSGIRTFTVIGSDGCEQKKIVTVNVEDCTGLETMPRLAWKVYPNPVSETLTVDTGNEDATVRIYDLHGSKVFDGPAYKADVHLLAPGIYMVRVIAGDSTAVFRIMKQ